MGTLTNDMTRLNDEITALRNGRREFLEDQRAFVQRSKDASVAMRATWNAARAQATKDLWAGLRTTRATRAALLREETAANETRRAAEAAELQQARTTFLAEVCGRVEEIRPGVHHLQAAFHDAHAEMAEAQREGLAASGRARRAQDANRIEEAQQALAARTDVLDGLREHVNELRIGVSRLRGECAADLAGAREAWAGVAAAGRPKTKQPVPEATTLRAKERGPEVEPVEVEPRKGPRRRRKTHSMI